MISFDFGQHVVEKVIDELNLAEEYIRVAVFQIHKKEVFNVLKEKAEAGLSIEIFTLPYDSINDDIRVKVSQRFYELERSGVKIYQNRWNIGNPERTSTAVGRWYSFHGKFIVTDQAAVSLSANFTETNELDATLIFRDDDSIKKFNRQFNHLVALFIQDKILDGIEDETLLALPNGISTSHAGHWIQDYPQKICQSPKIYDDGLYICPFDAKARDIISNSLQEAQQFAYIVIESFTDPGIVQDLIQAKLRGVDVKILTGGTSMDFTDRIQKMFRVLLGAGVQIKTTPSDLPLHAKILATEKRVIVSSINFNKINLGFGSKKLWRSNTETAMLVSKDDVIVDAQAKYEQIFQVGIDIQISLAKKLEHDVTTLFSRYYQLRSSAEVKEIFSRFILAKEVDVHDVTLKVGKIVKRLMERQDRRLVKKDDFLMALILYFLSDSKLTYNQLENKITNLELQVNIDLLLKTLIQYQYVEQENEFYKLDLMAFFDGGLK